MRLETRPPNIEGKGAVHQRQLVINSLRMRPDRIVIGEVRGDEALDMLQAMNTGHDGSLTTIHANSPRDALSRLETMVAMTNLNIPESAIRRQIASAIDVVVQVSRLSDGTRKVIDIAEITGMEGEIVSMQDIFVFKKRGIRETGEVLGDFVPTGIRPRFAERLAVTGIHLPAAMFSLPTTRSRSADMTIAKQIAGPALECFRSSRHPAGGEEHGFAARHSDLCGRRRHRYRQLDVFFVRR